MSLQSFRVENQKAIEIAHAEGIPPVMVIAGPNGVGKSTLLFAIKQGSGVTTQNTTLYYQGPHRILRRTNVRRGWLTGVSRWLNDVLTSGDVSGFEGLNFGNAARTPDNVDEAGSTIKYTLGKIENRRQTVQTEFLDRMRVAGRNIVTAELPEVYEPLRELTEFLLPHLSFRKVDFTNEDNIRSLWSRQDANQSIDVDIDDLSSGEKSIIVLFLPLIEDQIKERLETFEALGREREEEQQAADEVERVYLIDEPEQHLHPDLQAKLLNYIRRVSQESKTQFVLSTHSPTILDQASDQELYLLSPPQGDNSNQLSKIATSLERLEALKQLAGSAYVLTSGRALVCIEGSKIVDGGMSDLALLELLYPRAAAVTLVPAGGKGNVINTVQSFRQQITEGSFSISVSGLVDQDNSDTDLPDGIEALPGCMIENLLLDPNVMFQYCQSIEIEEFDSVEDLRTALFDVIRSLRDHEISRRISKALKPYTVRLGGSSKEEIYERKEEALKKLEALVPEEDKLAELFEETSDIVDQAIADESALRRFHGKSILKEFYARHIQSHQIGYSEMSLELARMVGEGGILDDELGPLFDRLLT